MCEALAVLGGEGRGSGIQSVKRHRIDRGQQVQAGWVARSRLAVGRCAAYQQHNGRNTVRFGVEHGQPPADDRRRGDVTYSGSSLECGRRTRGAWRHLLLAVEDGQFKKSWHCDEQPRRVYTMLRLRNPIMDGIRGFGLHLPQRRWWM